MGWTKAFSLTDPARLGHFPQGLGTKAASFLSSSLRQRRVVNMHTAMTRKTLLSRLVCLSVIPTLFFACLQPAWGQDEEEDYDEPEYRDPTIVTDDSTSTPDGVKELAKKFEKKPITNEWWFWATAIGVAGAWIALAVIPFQKRAPSCGTDYGLGCVGDGR